jgi:photosystem II stability/assembly factor-like uncharacterized protein
VTRTTHRLIALFLATSLGLWPGGARAHDASAWGGLFRTRDAGSTWFQASTGKVMGGAIAIAVDPSNPDHLLLGTDNGLLATSNAGRDWDVVAPELVGAVLAVAFGARGQSILAANRSMLVSSEDGVHWQSRPMPSGASPARALVADTQAGAFYLLGWNALLYTTDVGASWSPASQMLPEPVASIAVSADASVVVVAAGNVWFGQNHGRIWQPISEGLPPDQVEVVAVDPTMSGAVWAAGANQVFATLDDGQTWSSVGPPLPEHGTHVWAIASEAGRTLVSTDRGLYAGHGTWDLLSDNLPGHIEAGPLALDVHQPATLYVGFSVTPYAEIWQKAASGTSALGRLSTSEVAGAVAVLIMLSLGAGAGLRSLRGLRG